MVLCPWFGNGAKPELAHHEGGRAEAGEGRLQQIQPDEGRQQQPPGRDEMGQADADEDHAASEGEHGTVDVHGFGSGIGDWGFGIGDSFRARSAKLLGALGPQTFCNHLRRSMPSAFSTYFS